MACPYLFVLAANSGELPSIAAEDCLEELHSRVLSTGFCLRIHRCPNDWKSDIETLVEQGEAVAEGHNPLAGEKGSLLCCDAIIPYYEPSKHWLGIYKPEANKWEIVDKFLLRDADNEPCWFYPTENGTYLSWHSRLKLTTKPGKLAEPELLERVDQYSREKLHVLWSLMADEEEMTCVGITYKNLRIDWGIVSCKPEAFSTWSSFKVNDMEPKPLEVISTISTTRKITTSGLASH